MSDEMLQRALAVKRRYENELMRKDNVVAVGVGLRTRAGQATPEICVVVSVRRKVPAEELAPRDRIPPLLEDIPVDVLETGVIRAQP